MRRYSIYLCPKCKHFEYQALSDRKFICNATRPAEEIYGVRDPLGQAPDTCPDFVTKVKK